MRPLKKPGSKVDNLDTASLNESDKRLSQKVDPEAKSTKGSRRGMTIFNSRAKNPIIILLIFSIFFPIGLLLMWKYTDWSKKTKKIITGTVILILTVGLVSAYYSAPTVTVYNSNKSKINTDNANYVLAGEISSLKAARLMINEHPVLMPENGKFIYEVKLEEGDNSFILVATNDNGETREPIIIHRTTQAEFAARTEAEKIAAEKRMQEQLKKEADAKAKAEKKDSSTNSGFSWRWPFSKNDDEKAREKSEQERIAQEKVAAEAQKPKHAYEEYYTWSTTTLESLYGHAFGGTQADRQERWAYINSQCSIYQDIDGDGHKDQYYDKSCLQDKYKEYLRPNGFDYGSSRENGGSWICPADGEKYYSYICSKYGDLIAQTNADKSAGGGFNGGEERKKAEEIYNEIAITRGEN